MSLRLVKGLVIVMSAALAVGFVVLMVGLARQAAKIDIDEDAPPFRALLDLPEGAEMIAIAGAGNRIAVLVGRPGGRREIHLFDPSSGRVTGIVAAE